MLLLYFPNGVRRFVHKYIKFTSMLYILRITRHYICKIPVCKVIYGETTKIFFLRFLTLQCKLFPLNPVTLVLVNCLRKWILWYIIVLQIIVYHRELSFNSAVPFRLVRLNCYNFFFLFCNRNCIRYNNRNFEFSSIFEAKRCN